MVGSVNKTDALLDSAIQLKWQYENQLNSVHCHRLVESFWEERGKPSINSNCKRSFNKTGLNTIDDEQMNVRYN